MSEFTAHAGQIRDFKHLMVPAGETPWVEQHSQPTRPVDAVLYLGCNILRTAHLAYEVVDLFHALGLSFAAVAGPQFCCGVVHQREGDASGATRFAQATAAKFESYGAKQVVVWCPTCQLRFGELIQQGITSRFPMIHTTAFLAERVRQLPIRRIIPLRVAVHAHVGESQREMDATSAIQVLEAIPGVKVVGTLFSPDLNYHCSSVLMTRLGPERFRAIRENLVRRAKELGADTLVTTYHSCHREWCGVGEGSLMVRNYISIVAEALGCARPDSYQEFKKLGDPRAIAAASRPVWETYGLSEEQALGLAIKYFMPKKA
jgi:Fe-S oxidoreductase